MKDKEKEVLDCARKIKEFCGSMPNENECKQCIFRTENSENTTCILAEESCPEEWELDNILKKRLTDKQKHLLSLLDKKWKFIAKDKNGEVYLYESKPIKNFYSFNRDKGHSIYFENIYFENIYQKDMFDYLSWEDREASLIEDLLK